jgi:hypothetical protein
MEFEKAGTASASLLCATRWNDSPTDQAICTKQTALLNKRRMPTSKLHGPSTQQSRIYSTTSSSHVFLSFLSFEVTS